MAAGSGAVLTSFLINLCVMLGLFTLFTIVRVRPWAKRFFAPRRYARDVDLKPKRMSNFYLGWVKPIMLYKEEDIIDEVGLDSAMYLRVLWFGMELFFMLTLICIPLVLPANMSSREIARLLAQEAEAQTLVLNNSVVVHPLNTSHVDGNANDIRFMFMSQGVAVATDMAPWNTTVTFNASLINDDVLFVQEYFLNFSCKDSAAPYLSFAAYDGAYARISGSIRSNNQSLTVLLKDAIVFLGWQNKSVIPPSLAAVNNSGFDYIIVWSNDGEAEQVALTVNGKEFKFTDFDKYSLSNIPAGSAKMWCHIIALWLVTLFTMWRLREYNLQSVYLRLLFLGNAKRGGPSHTVLVTDVPFVSEAVACGLRAEEYREKHGLPPTATSLKKSMSIKNPVYEGYESLEGGPDGKTAVGVPVSTAAGAGEPRLPTTKSVTIVEPGGKNSGAGNGNGALQPTPSLRSSHAAALKQSHAAALKPINTSNGGAYAAETPRANGGGSTARSNDLAVSAFATANLEADAAADKRSAAGDTINVSGKDGAAVAKGSLLHKVQSVGVSMDECMKFRLHDPEVEPKYAATGGRLVMSRVGRSTEELRRDVLREDPDPTWLPPGYGVDTVVLKPDRRSLKRFRYDVKKLGKKPGDMLVLLRDWLTKKFTGVDPKDKEAARAAAEAARIKAEAEDKDHIGPRFRAAVTAAAMDPVEQAKAKLRSGVTPQQLVAQEFSLVYQPYNIAAVNMIQDTTGLEPLVSEYNQIEQKLEDYLDKAKLRLKLRKGLDMEMVRICPKMQGDAWPAVKGEMQRIIRSQYAFMAEQAFERRKTTLELHDKETDPKEKETLSKRVVKLENAEKDLPRQEAEALARIEKITNKRWSVKVDAVTYWLARLKYLRECIKIQQTVASRKISSSAFVTFNTRMAQSVASNSLHAHDETAWRISPAPAPIEVVWPNLMMTHPVRTGRLWLLWVAFWAMTLFFMVPVSLIQAMIEVPKLANIPVLGDIVTAPVIKQLLEAIIPGLVLKIFLAVVPFILKFMALLSGTTSLSEIDFGVVARFHLFQVVVVFFGSIIAGSFFNQVTEWVKNPASVISTLGKSIPMTATFFITYLFVNGLSVRSILFVRLPDFCVFWVLSKFAGSPRARERMWMNQFQFYGKTVPDHTIAMLLGLVFCCMNPIVCPAALSYFLVACVGERYNVIYVYRPQYESAGRLWKTIYSQIMVAMYIMLLAMFGLLAIKKFAAVFLLIPLIIGVVVSHISTLALYSRPWTVTALHDAAEMDMLEADQRREHLLAMARDERKKAKLDQKQRYERACIQAEENDKPAPPASDYFVEIKPGKAEKLLYETLEGDGFALNSAEKKEIADMYRNPGFTMHLERLEEVEKLARVVQSLLPSLNVFVGEYKSYRRTVKANQIKGSTAAVHAPHMPEDLTIFDNDPRLVSLDQEMAERPDDASSSLSAGEASDDEALERDVEAGVGMELKETKSAASSAKGFKQI
ncbi:hypothetical protein HXX76_013163 [Chlamydomonas incerta]|uniref:ERD4-related membrane protein n=1 Tax=Chlamydomonas incerta TaxID=51695 RepID=A0A835SJN8_CHLIN|nr:hypothetical protein HXX76_013163 [Chlamydomonas incerta]|eukprot:KAG2426182.1 hypothetical protein HXX76_013163 [Chlamydomonas incerta]